MERWQLVSRADPRANTLAKRHYTCQSPNSDQYVPPGRCLCLYSQRRGKAVWVTSWPLAEYVKHEWAGAWINSLFRSESRVLASVLIREAVAATRWYFGDPPSLGMVSFINPQYVRPKEQLGRCYIAAGFEFVGTTQGGLLAFQLTPDRMPEPQPPIGAQLRLAA